MIALLGILLGLALAGAMDGGSNESCCCSACTSRPVALDLSSLSTAKSTVNPVMTASYSPPVKGGPVD